MIYIVCKVCGYRFPFLRYDPYSATHKSDLNITEVFYCDCCGRTLIFPVKRKVKNAGGC